MAILSKLFISCLKNDKVKVHCKNFGNPDIYVSYLVVFFLVFLISTHIFCFFIFIKYDLVIYIVFVTYFLLLYSICISML